MALEKTGVELVAENAGKFNADMDKAADKVKEFDDAAGKAAGGVTKSAGGMGMAFAGIGLAAIAAAAEVAKAVGAMVVDSVKAAGDFEAATNKFGAVSGLSGEQLDAVREKALQLGQDTAYSAKEAQLAMIELAKGGVSAESIMNDAAQATLNLAASAGVGLVPAAEIVAKQLGVWKDQGLTATQAVDLLAQAANTSTVGVEDLALGMAQAGGTAKVGGLSFAELATTMAMISSDFASASDAGTSLKTMISRLIPVTDNQSQAMARLGLLTAEGNSVFFDAEGNFVGMAAASQLLQNATAGLSEEQKLMELNFIFGQDAIRAAAAVARNGAEGYTTMAGEMGKVGSAAEQAGQMNTGFNKSVDQMNGALETLQIRIGDKLLPVVKELIEGFTAIVNKISDWVAGSESATSDIAGVWEAFGKTMSAIWDGLMVVVDVVMKAWRSAAEAFQVFWAMYGDDIQRVISDVWAAVEALVEGVVMVWEEAFAGFQAFWAEHGESIKTSIWDVWEAVKGYIDAAITHWNSLVAGFQKFWAEHGDTIKKVAENVWNGIAAVVENGLKAAKGVLDIVLGTIEGAIRISTAIMKGDWEGAWRAMRSMVSTILGGVDTIISALGGVFVATMRVVVWSVQDVWAASNWGPHISKFVSDLGWWLQQGISSIWQQIIQAGKWIVEGIALGISSIGGAIWEALKASINYAVQGAIDLLRIGSPSRLMFEMVGVPIAEGTAAGIVASTPQVGAAAGVMARTAVVGAQSVTNNTSSTTTENYNLSVSTQQQSRGVAQDFGIMRTFAAAGR